MTTPKPKPTPLESKREADLLAALKMIATTTECGAYMRGIALSAIERHEGKDFTR